MHLALYQPDIPQNLGSILRLCACMGTPCHIVEPCGFVLDDARIRRVAMDYIGHVQLIRHASWDAFRRDVKSRIVLLTTRAQASCYDFAFAPGDVLLLGRESAGVPPEVADAAAAKIRIPMNPAVRSLNVASAAAMALGEALRQTRKTAPLTNL